MVALYFKVGSPKVWRLGVIFWEKINMKLLDLSFSALGYVYICQLYCSKTEIAAAKKVVNNWLVILLTI